MQFDTLGTMLTNLRHEARLSANPSHGAHNSDSYRHLLRRIQQELWLSYDWLHLQAVQSTDLEAGQRYLELPSRFDMLGVKDVETKDAAGRWVPVRYGIGINELNRHDSDADERAFPVRAWQTFVAPDAEETHTNMIEVWPIPDQDTRLRFSGKQRIRPLTDDSHLATIDSPLIVLHAAVEILAGQKAEDAQIKLQKAQDRARFLKLRTAMVDSRRANPARKSLGMRLRPGIDYIPE